MKAINGNLVVVIAQISYMLLLRISSDVSYSVSSVLGQMMMSYTHF